MTQDFSRDEPPPDAVDGVDMDKLNALNVGLTDELYAYFGALPDRQDVRVVILRGAGPQRNQASALGHIA